MFETIFVPELRSVLVGTLCSAVRLILLCPEQTLSRAAYANDLCSFVFYTAKIDSAANAITFIAPPVNYPFVKLNNPIFRVTWKDPDDGAPGV